MQRKQSKVLVFLLLWILAMTALPFVKARAAGKLQVVDIDYDKETMTVQSSGNDTFLYYSDVKMKNWECAYGQFKDVTDENGTRRIYVLDISWVKKTKDYVLVLKGDVSDGEVSVRLPMQNRYFKVKYNYLTQQFEPENAGNYPLQWRKADSTLWHNVVVNGSTEETVRAMNKLYAKGAYIYLRTASENGTSDANPGVRPSKEVKLSLKKQATAPSVSMKTAGVLTVNTTQEYRVDGSDEWKKCDGKTLDIGKIATGAFYNGETPGEDVNIYIRVAATEKKLPSASAVITVRAQEGAPVNIPTDAQNQIEYSFKNATTLQIKIKEVKSEDGKEVIKEKPSSKNPYEYTIVKPEAGASDPEKPAEDATWTAITAETVSISAEKAPEGSIIFIRKRGRLESKVVYQPESLACKYKITGYPVGSKIELADPENDAAFMETIEGKTYLRLVKEAGNKDNTKLKFKITVTGFETDIASITCGGKALSYTATKEAVAPGTAEGSSTTTGSAITVTITDTSECESAMKEFNKDQPLKITLKNGEVISDKVTLKVLPGASVQTEKTFEVTHRIAAKQTEYTFVVSAGIKLEGSKNNTPVYTTIDKIMFEDSELDSSVYSVTPTENGASYTVTVQETAFDHAFLSRGITLDKAYPLVIKMSNGQEIKSGISVKLHENAKVGTEKLVSMKVGTEYEAISLVFTFTDQIQSVRAVTWNGLPVTCVSESEENTMKVTISELKNLTLGESETSLEKPIIFEFSDGSLVSRAIFLTLTKQ